VGVDHELRIRLGGEAMAAGLELLSKLEEVVDLTVEYDADAAVFVEDRLITGVQVDDRQAAHRQADLAGFRPEHPLAVWPAVAQCIVHVLQHRAIGTQGADDASDSAHGYTPGGTSWSVGTCRGLRRPDSCAGGSDQRRERGT